MSAALHTLRIVATVYALVFAAGAIAYGCEYAAECRRAQRARVSLARARRRAHARMTRTTEGATR